MRVLFFLVSSILSTNALSFGLGLYSMPDQNLIVNDSFPIPIGVENQLFYIQRTPNINTIMYALNIDENGQLDEVEPIHPFWIRYAEDSLQKELSYLQKNYAYGLRYDKISNEKYRVRFVSYKKYEFFLMRSQKDKSFRAYAAIDNKLAILNQMFLQIEGGTFWFPHVVYVELRGVDPDTGKEVFTRFKP